MMFHPSMKQSHSEKLNAAVNEAQKRKHNDENKSELLGKELRVFEATGERTQNLNIIYNALMSIPPTSVESERVFSTAGLFITKMRTRLSDRSINCLCFLKSYFRSKKE